MWHSHSSAASSELWRPKGVLYWCSFAAGGLFLSGLAMVKWRSDARSYTNRKVCYLSSYEKHVSNVSWVIGPINSTTALCNCQQNQPPSSLSMSSRGNKTLEKQEFFLAGGRWLVWIQLPSTSCKFCRLTSIQQHVILTTIKWEIQELLLRTTKFLMGRDHPTATDSMRPLPRLLHHQRHWHTAPSAVWISQWDPQCVSPMARCWCVKPKSRSAKHQCRSSASLISSKDKTPSIYYKRTTSPTIRKRSFNVELDM